ncbi:FkbM family methyltransferase [Crateriforma spongiae]|uniref:FkbM family methyltransferase n=1 Tax=Crateriforma spongiae TaxID=2724528 RepID=UPI0014457C14|nr:FkbM family methyltransferase [Crateriforma spongiae]
MPFLLMRLRKLAKSVFCPACWHALALGVTPTIEHIPLIEVLDVDGIIDVGGNRGQFSLACQLAKKDIPIVAFEPIPSEAETFRKVHGANEDIVLIESALGETAGEATLHLSNRADSSSLLPIGKRQTELFPKTVEVGTITVSVKRLDDCAELWKGRTSQLLKIDVQGFELSVLKGASDSLKNCKYVYVECSEVALYDGQALRSEVSEFLKTHNFSEQGRYNPQFSNGELVQADYLYVRV